MGPLQILITTTDDFTPNPDHLERIRSIAPGAGVRLVPRSDVSQADVNAASIIFGRVNPKLLGNAPNLRWLQLSSAGADGFLDIHPDTLLTKASGTFGIPIAEWVIGSMLMLTRNLHRYRDQQHRAIWKSISGAREVYGSTVGIVGLGDIGQEVAKRAAPLGCRILGCRRTNGPAPAHVEAVFPLEALLPQVEFLVLALPGTPENDRLITGERLAQMRRGAYLINVGRGASIDEEALIEALRSGHLAGAALDVTTVEPLPPDSPLWQMEQVIISPHASFISLEGNTERRLAIFCENLRRYVAGERLHNLVDRTVGY
jgi:phosphoglycerate dehydrogenase-like enzyme